MIDSRDARHRRNADRRRIYRQDNPRPRPSDNELLTMYASLTCAQIANDIGRNENTVRSWISRAMWRQV